MNALEISRVIFRVFIFTFDFQVLRLTRKTCYGKINLSALILQAEMSSLMSYQPLPRPAFNPVTQTGALLTSTLIQSLKCPGYSLGYERICTVGHRRVATDHFEMNFNINPSKTQ